MTRVFPSNLHCAIALNYRLAIELVRFRPETLSSVGLHLPSKVQLI